MKWRVFFILCSAFSIFNSAQAQEITQTIRGNVLDAESKFPLFGAVVTVHRDSLLVGGSNCGEEGEFRIANVPVGKVRVKVSLIGYSERILDNVEVTSAKEVVLNIEIESSTADIETVEIKAIRDGDVKNEMAVISARQFSVAETDRYAGSRGDPARMASNFAGVQGADDSRNDIVIRGNSPQGVLWRMEGVDIPNPNHFAIAGTAGGPVSIINNKYLANSDFFTGAFPADYGNSVAGVFDLKMRNGNNEKHEFSAQFGFLGTELFAEGPLNKKTGSSYLASYRYSTVELFSVLGIDIGTSATPKYQDGAFRLFFPRKKNSSLALWGIGGMSSIDILVSNQTNPDETELYGENDRDQYFKTKMGVLGLTHSKSFSENTFLKTTIAVMADEADSYHELVYRHVNNEGQFEIDSLTSLLDYTFQQTKISLATFVNHKLNRNITLRIGTTADSYVWSNIDSVRTIDTTQCDYYQYRTRWNNEANALLIQPYAQLKWRPNEAWTLTAGIHNSFFTLNDSYSLFEPRIGARWQFTQTQSLSFGAGRHSQLQPVYMYFYSPQLPDCVIGPDEMKSPNSQPNRDMGFTMSDHLVLGYQNVLKSRVRLLMEVYYQSLFDIPVEINSSSFSLVNTGAGFTRFFPGTLMNHGTARNVGIEFTVEKFFSRGWLALFTASVFDAKYKGSDGVERNTDFNGGYAVNALASKEWKTGTHSAFITGIKVTTAGGRWYGPADAALSVQQREIVFVDSLRNTIQFRPYFRLDVKLNYKINRPKVTHEIGLDLVNTTGQQNILKLTYAPDDLALTSDIREEYQLGFLPVFFYKIDF